MRGVESSSFVSDPSHITAQQEFLHCCAAQQGPSVTAEGEILELQHQDDKQETKIVKMGVWTDFIFDNTYAVDAKEAEANARKKYPLLFHENEKVILAFKDRGGKGCDKEYFTDVRILIKDGKGIGSRRKNLSIPYDTILAFAVQTAGSLLDQDCELDIWTTVKPKLSINFSSTNVDIFQIYQFLNMKVDLQTARGTGDVIDATPPKLDKKQTNAGNVIDWLGDKARQVDHEMVEEKLKTEFPILLEQETVELAFQSGRDFKVFTNMRVLMMDVKGLAGKKIEFLTILYSYVYLATPREGVLPDKLLHIYNYSRTTVPVDSQEHPCLFGADSGRSC